MRKKRVIIIGAGFSGLSAASFLGKDGWQVDVYEKNETPGGRARNFSAGGFTFDMGPTWYWMPEVFENFFGSFGKKVEDYYELQRLDPGYRMFFSKNEHLDVPASYQELLEMFENIEPGSSKKLDIFLKEAEYKYEVGVKNVVFKPGKSAFEFLDRRLLAGIIRLDFFRSLSKVVRSNFKDQRLIRILEFPVIFLGATPQKTPALYSLMNYADLKLGTWYPTGGMYSVIEGMYKLAREEEVNFHFNAEVTSIRVKNNYAEGIMVNGKFESADVVIASADYAHVDQYLLSSAHRQYSPKYWANRDMAPSALLFYLGLNKRIKKLEHHNLFFDENFEKHADVIYDNPSWPEKPAIYVSASSKTDASIAPKNSENIIVLIPVAPGLKDTEEIKQMYYDMVIDRIEKITGDTIRDHVVFKRSYAQSDFINDYHAYKGNAYGLSNTILQTAFLKPKMHHKNIRNLLFTGQLTTPGPGVPPTIISGEVAAREASKLTLKV